MMNHPLPNEHLCLIYFSAGRALVFVGKGLLPSMPVTFFGLDYFVHTKSRKMQHCQSWTHRWVTHVLHSSCALLPPPFQNGSCIYICLALSKLDMEHSMVSLKALVWKIALNFSGSVFCCLHTLLFGNSHHHLKESN